MDNEPIKNSRPISEIVAEWEAKRPEEMAAARERVKKFIEKLDSTKSNATDASGLMEEVRANFRGNPAFGDEDEVE